MTMLAKNNDLPWIPLGGGVYLFVCWTWVHLEAKSLCFTDKEYSSKRYYVKTL